MDNFLIFLSGLQKLALDPVACFLVGLRTYQPAGTSSVFFVTYFGTSLPSTYKMSFDFMMNCYR
jgi:hypothetical protein